MKRSHIVVFFLGILVAVVSNHALSLVCPLRQAKADIAWSSLSKPYQLTFREYLSLYLKVNYARPLDSHGCYQLVMPVNTDRGIRFRITGSRGKDSPASRSGQLITRNLEQIPRMLEEDIKGWKQKGYDIADGDIEIDSSLKP